MNRETEQIDYDEVARIARECRPKVIVAGGSAYARFLDFPRFREISDEVGAVLVVDMAHIAGLVAGGVHPSPVPHAQIVTSTTHKTLRGPRSGLILCDDEHKKAIDKTVFPGMQGGPLMHVIAAKAVAFHEALQPAFKSYATTVVSNAKVLASSLEDAGLRIVSGGTDTHLLLVDLRSVGLDGKTAERVLDVVGITANRNAIPFDPEPPNNPSGLRLGSAAVTTRGFTADDMRTLADMIATVLHAPTDDVSGGKLSPGGRTHVALPRSRHNRLVAAPAPRCG